MANRSVPYGSCGTKKTGWFFGRLPQVTEGIMPAKVCFNDGYHSCDTEVSISVRQCDGFYVYKLPKSTKGCYKAYCGNGE